MARYTATWKARVEQEIEVEADTDEEAEGLIRQEMEPGRVVELLDFEIDDLERHDVDPFEED
jgi:hypothetical protein